MDTACARTVSGTRGFENFEVELKRHATPVEVVADNETFPFGQDAVEKNSRGVIFPVAVGLNVFLLRASQLDEEVPLLISMGVVKQLTSSIGHLKCLSWLWNWSEDNAQRTGVHLTYPLHTSMPLLLGHVKAGHHLVYGTLDGTLREMTRFWWVSTTTVLAGR